MTRTELARKIERAAGDLQHLIGRADDVLQADEMPEPWDQWQAAVDAAQDVWLDLQLTSEIGERITRVTDALQRADKA